MQLILFKDFQVVTCAYKYSCPPLGIQAAALHAAIAAQQRQRHQESFSPSSGSSGPPGNYFNFPMHFQRGEREGKDSALRWTFSKYFHFYLFLYEP